MLDLATAAGSGSPESAHALAEAARRLALWMCYEDVARVADLKTRPERFAKIRADAEMSDDQLLTVTEYLKPGADEIAAVLPAGVGVWFMRRVARKGPPGFIGQGINVATTSVHGWLTDARARAVPPHPPFVAALQGGAGGDRTLARSDEDCARNSARLCLGARGIAASSERLR